MKVLIPIIDWQGNKLNERAEKILNKDDDCVGIIALADHGVADSLLSLKPKTYTWAEAVLISEGEHNCQKVKGIQNHFYDISVDRYFAELANIETDTKVARCSRNLLSENSLEGPRLQKAIDLGYNEGIKHKRRALVLSNIGAGSEISLLFTSRQIIAKDELLNDWPENLQQHKGRDIQTLQATEVLEKYGGYDTAFLLGVILGAVSRENFLFLAGYSAISAAIISLKFSRDYSQFMCSTGELPYKLLQEQIVKLGIEPISKNIVKAENEDAQLKAAVRFINEL